MAETKIDNNAINNALKRLKKFQTVAIVNNRIREKSLTLLTTICKCNVRHYNYVGVFVNVCMYICMQIYVRIYVCVHVCIYVCMCACVR